MLHRRSTATALVAVLLPLAATLTSCGFDYPTDRVNTIAAGTNNREASVDVLGARVIAYSEGHGRLIGTFVYNANDATEPAVLESVEGEAVQAPALPEIEVVPTRLINLAADGVEPIAVEGDFTAGDFVTLTYSFSTQEIVTLEVPVVKPCGQYADIAAPEGAGGSAADDAEDTDDTEDAEGHEDEGDATYLCEHPTDSAEGEEGGH